MIENLQDELYQLENKEGEGAKLCDKHQMRTRGRKMLKNLFQCL